MRTILIAALVLTAVAGVASAHNECNPRSCYGSDVGHLGRCVTRTSGQWINICAPGEDNTDAWTGNDKGCWSIMPTSVDKLYENGTIADTGSVSLSGVSAGATGGGDVMNCTAAHAELCVKDGRNNYTAYYVYVSFSAYIYDPITYTSCSVSGSLAISTTRQATTLSYDSDHSKEINVGRGDVTVSIEQETGYGCYPTKYQYRFNYAVSNHGKNPRTPAINPDAARPTADGITFLEVATNKTASSSMDFAWIDTPVSYTEKYVRNDDTWKMEKYGYLSLTMAINTTSINAVATY